MRLVSHQSDSDWCETNRMFLPGGGGGAPAHQVDGWQMLSTNLSLSDSDWLRWYSAFATTPILTSWDCVGGVAKALSAAHLGFDAKRAEST